jgi:phosphate transport system protein
VKGLLRYSAPVTKARAGFRKDLLTIEEKVMQLFPLVSEDITLATEALLGGGADVLRVVREREQSVNSIYGELEDVVGEEIAMQTPVAGDLRLLLSVLRALPEVERSHDLVGHIAELATHTLSGSLSPRACGLIKQMGDTGANMWDQARDAWTQRDAAAALQVEEKDEEIDSLYASLMAELASGSMTLPVTMDLTLVARFYERLGDHARNIARRVPYLAGQLHDS